MKYMRIIKRLSRNLFTKTNMNNEYMYIFFCGMCA